MMIPRSTRLATSRAFCKARRATSSGSGDGDFRRLVEIVASRGVRVEVVAFGQSTAADLRAVADRYIDIAAYVPEFSVGPK